MKLSFMILILVVAALPPVAGYTAETSTRVEFRLGYTKPIANGYKTVTPDTNTPLWISNTPVVTSSDIVETTLLPPRDQLGYRILIRFSPEAGKRLFRVTSKHLREQMALIVDGKVLAVLPIATAFGSDVVIDAGENGEYEELVNHILEKLMVATGIRIQGKGRLVSVPANDEDKVIGHLSWIATDTECNTVLATGDSDIRMQDIQVFDTSRVLARQAIRRRFASTTRFSWNW